MPRWCQAEPDLASPENGMFYIYILHSKINKDLYIGFTEDLRKRFKEHNNKEIKSTKAYCPWILIYYESYLSKLDATKREKQLKMHRVKSDLRLQIKNSLEE